ncbi:MAG: hypothetical protein J5517_11015 [Eubacterium sp.]|nr:hypothetical protein [Eubacterium sp.]
MKGTAPGRILNRSIVKHIPAYGAGRACAGRDYSILEEDNGSGQAVVLAEGYSVDSVVAYLRAANNLATSGAAADKITVNIVAGKDTPENVFRSEMLKLTDYARSKNIRIIGGNTVYSGQGSEAAFTVTAYGKTPAETLKKLTRMPEECDKLVIFGNVGEYGASVIAAEKREELKKRFPESYMECYNFPAEKLDITHAAKCLIEAGAVMLHDISFGGVFRALHDIAEYSGLGLEILHENVPIKQSTIELTEYFNINPYMLLGTGGLIAVVKPDLPENVLEEIEQKTKTPCRMAGRLTKERQVTITSEVYQMRRSIGLYEEDEIYKVLK